MNAWNIRRTLVALAALAMLCSGATLRADDTSGTTPPVGGAAAPATSLADLLNRASLAFTKMQDGTYKIIVESSDGPAIVVYGTESAYGDKAKIVQLWMTATPLPDGFTPSAALYKRILEMNDKFIIGSVVMNKTQIYTTVSFIIPGADPSTLISYFQALYDTGSVAKKELVPFVKEAQ